MQRRRVLPTGKSRESRQRHTISLSCHKEAKPHASALSRSTPMSGRSERGELRDELWRLRVELHTCSGSFVL